MFLAKINSTIQPTIITNSQINYYNINVITKINSLNIS